MASFGKKSKERLGDLDPGLRTVLEDAIELTDFTVLETIRGKHIQDKLYAEGKSTLKYPESKHNSYPSLAVDIAPYPIDWEDSKRFVYLAGIIMGIAAKHGVKVRWGGNWDQDDVIIDDQNFDDLPHFEVAG
tara:strand:+ start:1687 stop:2082 length:396 start_codon:yes stop_codon:yes gene_type:complete